MVTSDARATRMLMIPETGIDLNPSLKQAQAADDLLVSQPRTLVALTSHVRKSPYKIALTRHAQTISTSSNKNVNATQAPGTC